MKKLIIASICFFFVIGVKAQSGAVGFTYGLFAGTTSTDISTNIDYDDKTSGAGFTVGAFSRFKVLFLTIQPEIAYSKNNVTLTANDGGNLYQAKLSSDIFEINGLINLLGISLGDAVKLRLPIGVGYSIDMGSTIDFNGSKTEATNTVGTYFNGLAGLGIDVLGLTADFRYRFGFSDIVEGSAVDITPNVFVFTLGYKFR
ncbi:MAG: outer membrane beta-barrel protein [Bacteroidetes bacterium]|nr:outer membrane beta-barrel protein [Bacteroidota bacterium]MBP8754906.1 outer membrane beta-barrel protein [Chitinophagales bacterium]MBK7109524.1 outer membrane beta-barrel protein [Bacteroidota bacterium]MBK8487740.1 outer membrane beta-barrel protein [Bacteroidota bacterium]MBK8682505.1 outer membrane beta-barrel protein [Bacteroidota bacterium]